MNKLKMHSPNLTETNIDKIAELFPNCITESKDEKGQNKRVIDFDRLRQELSDHVIDGPRERYQLDWPGKREAQLVANAPIAKTLRPIRKESVNFDTTKNLFIVGDNLDALKLMQETYLNKIKMIYIDPPYNTGDDFLYEDDFAENANDYLMRSNQKDALGNRLIANTVANGRFHSDWLSMLYPRLKLSRNLLKDDGVIFISADDNEYANLKCMCAEIFGENNFLGTILWKKKTNGNNMGYIPPVHDYILCFAKRASENCILGFPFSDDYVKRTYSNPDNDPRGPWTTSDLSANHEGPHFKITNPNTGNGYYPAKGRYWVFNEDEVCRRIKDGRIIFGKTGTTGPIQKKFLNERSTNRIKPESWWDNHGQNEDGTKELGELFQPKVFDHPKPTTLLARLIQIASSNDDIVLDFFAGSGSIGHAVFEQNRVDGGNRRFICIQMPEKCDEKSIAFSQCGFHTITDLSMERIRRAGKKIHEKAGLNGSELDLGFRVLILDTSNMKDIYYQPDKLTQQDLHGLTDNVKEDRTDEDLLFHVMLDWGADLASHIAVEKIEGKSVYFVNTNDIAACFEPGIDEAFIKELSKRKPLRAVFRDNGYGSDSAKINVEQIFKLLSPSTEVKSI